MPKRFCESTRRAKRRVLATHSVEKICQYALDANIDALNEMLENGECLSSYLDHRDAVSLLAERGAVSAVDFLINHFKANINNAVIFYALKGLVDEVERMLAQGAAQNSALQGFAAAGNLDRVNLMISKGGNINIAVFGLAVGGYVSEVNKRITQGADARYALMGFSVGGHFDFVTQLFESVKHPASALLGASRGYYVQTLHYVNAANKNVALYCYALSGDISASLILMMGGADVNCAVRGFAQRGDVVRVQEYIKSGASLDQALLGYAQGGHIDQVNRLITNGAARKFAVDGYKLGGLLNSISVLRLVVLTDDTQLQSMLVKSINETECVVGADSLFKKANQVKDTMAYYQIAYHQALSLVENTPVLWLLRGLAAMGENHIPGEIFFHITSFVLRLTQRDVISVYSAVHMKLELDRKRVVSTVRNQICFFSRNISQGDSASDSDVILLNCNRQP